ncbi:hypothetical protein CRYUN_Cryun09bG0182600 [Craigia yunnanensis]
MEPLPMPKLVIVLDNEEDENRESSETKAFYEGVAVDHKNSLNNLCLLIKDYPYAVDGLEIWFAIKKWVRDYCSFYYKTDEMVQQDPEL